MPFTPLGDALHKKLGSNLPLKKQLESAEAVVAAELVLRELFAVELFEAAKPLFLKNRTLTISCASSVIAQEIRLNQAEIVQKINAKLGKNEVDRIRYLA